MKKLLLVAIGAVFSFNASAQALTLHGASQFNDDHAFTKALADRKSVV